VHEVLGPVDGIDGEGVVRLGEPVQQRGVDAGGLLPDDEDVRVVGEQGRGEQLLGLVVGDGDEVTGALLHDLAGGEGPEAGGDDLGGDVLHEVEYGLGVHGFTLPHDVRVGGPDPLAVRLTRRTAWRSRPPRRPAPARSDR
jgi:hypothetical protein